MGKLNYSILAGKTSFTVYAEKLYFVVFGGKTRFCDFSEKLDFPILAKKPIWQNIFFFCDFDGKKSFLKFYRNFFRNFNEKSKKKIEGLTLHQNIVL